MTAFLPPNLLALFAPRDPIPYLPPADKLPYEKKVTHNYTGIAQYVHLFEDPVDTPAPVQVESRDERKDRRKKEKSEQVAYKLEQEIALWDPNTTGQVTEDPFKTLFMARINYYTSESKLRREFETYGTVKNIRIVQNVKNGKPRGYAFIEYESERDMHCKYILAKLNLWISRGVYFIAIYIVTGPGFFFISSRFEIKSFKIISRMWIRFLKKKWIRALSLLFCLHTYSVRRSIDFLDSKTS